MNERTPIDLLVICAFAAVVVFAILLSASPDARQPLLGESSNIGRAA